MYSPELKKIISKIYDLPSLPIVVDKILTIMNSSNSASKDLANIISKDYSLTAKVLRLVNSSFYGFSEKISTITHSVVILGFHNIKNIAIGLSVFDSFNKKSGTSLFDKEEFWKHSLACGICSREIAIRANIDIPEEALVAGLLHAIGVLILDTYLPKEFTKTLLLMKEKNILMAEAEQEIIGVTHNILGEWLAAEWKLPPLLKNVIKYSHNPTEASNITDNYFFKMINIVHLAHLLCPVSSICGDGKNTINIESFKSIGISEKKIPEILSHFHEEIKKAMISFKF